MPPAELFPPEAYAGGWLVAAVLAIAVVVLWPIAVVMITRPKPVRVEAPAQRPAVDQRSRALSELAELWRRWEAGSLSTRHAHQEISTVVRSYVATAGQPGVETMTLAELRAASERTPRLTAVADLVEELYPPEFAAGDDATGPAAHPALTTTVLRGDPTRAFGRAAEVIRGWS
ncbi:MAG: hypothetical protein ACTH2Q_09880 [Propionibacteriaceae bacterium]